MMTTTSEMKNRRDLKNAAILAPPEQALRPHIHDGDKKQERRNGPVGGRDQIGGNGFEITDHERGNQRTGYAAEATKHHDRKRTRGERAHAVRAYPEKHSEEHASDAGKNAVNRPDHDID